MQFAIMLCTLRPVNMFSKKSSPDAASQINIFSTAYPSVVHKDYLDALIKHVQEQLATTIRANVTVTGLDIEGPMVLTVDHNKLEAGHSQKKVQKHVGRIMGHYRANNGCTVAYPGGAQPRPQAELVRPFPQNPQGFLQPQFQQAPPCQYYPTSKPVENNSLVRYPVMQLEHVNPTLGRYENTTRRANEEAVVPSAPHMG